MPPPPDETSRPARRRALGRGPGTPRPTPSDPQPTPETAQAASPAPAAESAPASARRSSADAEPAPGLAAASPAPAAESAPAPVRRSSADAEPAPGPAEAHPGADTARQPAPGTADVATSPAGVSPQAPAGSAGESDTASALGVDAPARDGDSVVDPAAAAPESVATPPRDGGGDGRFTVRLANFEGPFDLLLQLISKHKLDVTEVALSKVTDEFMAHIRAMGPDWDLDQTTEFLVVAATLLDLKAARLLPAAEVEDEADLALLEARDLLFARLLQYRAYKQIATIFEDRWEAEGWRYPRTVGLEAHHAELLPEVVISIGAEGFAKLAVNAMQPRAKPQVYVDHIHAPLVSVREQAGIVVALLRERGSVSFRELTDSADDTLTVVARFLALLELYREKAVALDQEDALGELTVTWVGGERETQVTDEFDQPVEEKA
ncbi:segregation/condensation protein A [Streptomyces sp. NPDC059567]|uniref:segregation/condensation protein A n=1 Tax=Streptomyces sp. NPDC059567 TaxID=3346867 RepID=UPI00369B7DF9